MQFAFLTTLFVLDWKGSINFCSEKDAQMCIYHMSWQSNFGFCCELDEECAQELAGQQFDFNFSAILVQ